MSAAARDKRTRVFRYYKRILDLDIRCLFLRQQMRDSRLPARALSLSLSVPSCL